MTKACISFFIFLIPMLVLADQTISCSHLELCKMLDLIKKENHLTSLKTENLVTISGDPHEFEPSTDEIKKLINAHVLLSGPHELNPWIKKLQYQRSKVPTLKSIALNFTDKDRLFYPKATPENLSHFWLYPEVYCSLKAQLENELVKLDYRTIKPHRCDSQDLQVKIKESLKSIQLPIILTHDALLPYLYSLDSQKIIIAIKGSGHHEEATPAAIKKLYDVLKSPKVVWVLETGINVAPNILSKIRANDLVIKIDSGNSKSDLPLSVLEDLSVQLKQVAEIKK